MTARSRMTMRADIEKNTTTASNDWNTPDTPSWSTDQANVPCYFWIDAKRYVQDDGKTVLVEDPRCIVATDTDIDVSKRIANIKDRRGYNKYTGPYEILAIHRLPTHYELILRQVSDA